MSSNLPVLLEAFSRDAFPAVSSREQTLLGQAKKLFDAGFYDHALLDVWNASISNLRRRVERYSVDIFLSTVKDEGGRKKYDFDGEQLSERWSGVDDLVLISGATRLGLLNKKAGKALEMINWMRNHASPAHETENSVDREDVIALVLLLQKNLFEASLPDQGHSAATLFDPVKNCNLNDDGFEMLIVQIRGLVPSDVRIAFGFMLDLLGKGQEPAYANVSKLFPILWERGSDELKKTVGLRYHALKINPEADDSVDKKASDRILYFLTEVQGILYIPDVVRAAIYRRAVKKLARAKDTGYGWHDETVAARSLAQFGPHVPSSAFEDVYQEIVAVHCGNYWGRSSAFVTLRPFIESLNINQIRDVVRLFKSNERVRAELEYSKPKKHAIDLLLVLKERLTLEAHKSEVDDAISDIEELES